MSTRKIDFLIVTVLQEEYDAVLSFLQPSRVEYSKRRTETPAYITDIPRYSGLQELPARVALIRLNRMGRLDAGLEVSSSIRQWRPSFVLLVGIAGGVADAGVALGDVLVADQIVDYSLQKVGKGGKRTIHPQGHPVDPIALSIISTIPPSEWIERLPNRPKPGQPKVCMGPLGSGDTVVAHTPFLEQLRRNFPKLIGVEMEAAGVATACFRADARPSFFMIRAASDLADAKKNSTKVRPWRPYACLAAASFAISLLARLPLRSRNKSREKSQTTHTVTDVPPKQASAVSQRPSLPTSEYDLELAGERVDLIHTPSDLNGPAFLPHLLTNWWGVPGANEVLVEFQPNCRTIKDLKCALEHIHEIFELTPRGAFAISQSNEAWHGMGASEFITHASRITERYERGSGPWHHSEALIYCDEFRGGWLLVSAQQQVEDQRLHHLSIEFRLPGLPIDTAPFIEMFRRLNTSPTEFQLLNRQGADSTSCREWFKTGSPIRLKSVGRILRRRDAECMVAGIIAENPFLNSAPTELQSWRGLQDSGLWLCALRDWHGAASQKDRYELVGLEQDIRTETIMRVDCTW